MEMIPMHLMNKIVLNKNECDGKDDKENITEYHEKEELKILCTILPNLLVEKNVDLAIDVLQEHCRVYSRHAKAYIFLGRLYELKNEYNVSLNFYRLAVFLQPESFNFSKIMKSAQIRFLQSHQVSLSLKIQCYSFDTFYKNLFSNKAESVQFESLLLQSELNVLLDITQNSTSEINRPILSDGLKNGKCLWEEEVIFPYYRYSKEIIKAGEILSYERPYAVAPMIPLETYKISTTCFHCLRERCHRKTTFTCPMYPKTCPFLFCSSECVLQNSLLHRQECQFITTIVFPLSKKTGFSFSFILLVLRVLIRAYNEESVQPYEKNNIPFFLQSSSCYTSFKNGGENRFWIDSCLNAFVDDLFLLFPIEFLLGFNKKEMKHMISLIHTYCISVTCQSLSRHRKHVKLGLVFSLEICHFQHSCLPNCCSIYSKEGHLLIRALQNINLGDKLTISYLDDLMLPTSQRKQLDSSLSILSCQCERCSSSDENQRYIRGQRCSFCIQGICNPSNYLFSDYLYYLKKDTCFFSKTLQEKKHSFLNFLTISSNKILPENTNTNLLDNYFVWTCSKCGPLSLYDSQRCYQLEKQAEDLLNKIKENYSLGERVTTLKLCQIFFSKYNVYFHSNHYLSYHIHLYSVGIFQYYKKYHQALYHVISALHIAHHILPVFHSEKIHLYKVYSDLLLTSKSTLSSYDALWIAVVNAWFTCAPKSSQWVECLLCLRSAAKQINQHTPPLIQRPQLIPIHYPIHYTIYEKFHIPNQEILNQLIKKNYQSILYQILLTKNTTLLQKLFSSLHFLRRELECPNMITGLTALGFATSLSDPSLVQCLLSYNVNCFSENELNVTPLISMASQPYLNKILDQKQAKICSLLCRHIEQLQNTLTKENKIFFLLNNASNSFHTNILKNQFLQARVHSILGKNTAAHYAAAYGKEHLLFQLFYEGLSMEINNAEHATPLHLAAMNGHHGIVERMLKKKCSVEPSNIWGLTPLLLACYNLHVPVVQTFINYKVNIFYQTSHTKISCLHALILGLTKTSTFSTTFNTTCATDSQPFYNQFCLPQTFTTNLHSLNETHSFKLSCNSFSKKNNETLLIFPDVLQTRLEKTHCILQLLANIIPTPRTLLNARLAMGLTPSELLESRVKILFKLHQHAWSHTTLRLTTTKHTEMRETWRIIFLQLDDLIEKLRPPKIKKKSP